MATFPALNPTSRTYIPGQPMNTSLLTMEGDETAVRHSNAALGHILRLGFTGLTADQHFLIVSHYGTHGRFESFDIPSSITEGANITFPSGYVFIYAGSPQTEYVPSVFTVQVELELIPSYTL
jgi:hypothetical protein|tara:strand:- start:134 stop:502 length:369 start_codon:yes stop_codon:yes gene_type:complete